MTTKPEDSPTPDPDKEASPTGKQEPEKAPPSDTSDDKDSGLLKWAVAIVAILAVELYIYGHDAQIEVCVGIKGVTQFELAGTPPTPKNQRKHPQCSERSNLGMWSSSADQTDDALEQACKMATRTNRALLKHCLRNDGKWTRRVSKSQIPPWDARLYRRLLWID